jgi:hypothetical protein
LIDISDKEIGLNLLISSIWDQGNTFLRKLLNIFDMQLLPANDIPRLIESIDGLKFLFSGKQNEVAQLTMDVKIMMLNAEQKKFCEELKTSMEQETWTAFKFSIEINQR